MRIQILFFTVSKTVSFKIGTVQLPTPIYLAGDRAELGDTTARRSGRGATRRGDLYLNMGDRAATSPPLPGRGVGEAPRRGLHRRARRRQRAGETVRIKAMGREQTLAGVKTIYAFGGYGNDTIIVREGVRVRRAPRRRSETTLTSAGPATR